MMSFLWASSLLRCHYQWIYPSISPLIPSCQTVIKQPLYCTARRTRTHTYIYIAPSSEHILMQIISWQNSISHLKLKPFAGLNCSETDSRKWSESWCALPLTGVVALRLQAEKKDKHLAENVKLKQKSREGRARPQWISRNDNVKMTCRYKKRLPCSWLALATLTLWVCQCL